MHVRNESEPSAPAAHSNKKLNIYVSWENLRFEVPDPNDKKKTKVILHGLNGHVKPGELVAVIGPSGSGKSSFLNCVAGRTVEGVTGKLLFNNVKRPTNFARFTGYVVQDDLYFESLTVKETLTFAADLKLPMSMSKQQKRQRVRDVIDQLDLGKCENTQIGTIGEGISGGERRRLAIGLEILNEPSLLLLDEPTSGLDSASALMVGKILQRLCRVSKITILCTIHQPRYALATMFDKLYFLAKGNEIYFGPTIPKCLTFFENAGYNCPEYDNPADFLLDLVNTALDKNATNMDVAAVTGTQQQQHHHHRDDDSSSAASGTSGASGTGTGTFSIQMPKLKSESTAEDSNATEDEMEKLAATATTPVNDDHNDHDNDNASSDGGYDSNTGIMHTTKDGDIKMPEIVEDNTMKVPQRSRDEIVAHLADEYAKSKYKKKALDFNVPENERGDIIFRTIASDFYITPWYNQFRVILIRSFLHKAREPIALMTQAFNATLMPLMFGSVFWQIDLSQQASLDRLSAISILIIMLSFFAFDILMLFPLERNIFNRENASGMYRPSMFYFGRTFAEIPQHIILMAIMGTLAYFMYGLQNDVEKFLTWLLLFELSGLAGTSLLLAFSAYAKTLEQSNLLATFFLLLFMLFDGNWISIDKVPSYWKWVQYVSLFAYGAQGAIVNEYRGLNFKCTESEEAKGECFYDRGIDVLYVRGLDDVSVADCIWGLAVLIVAFRLIAFIGVLFLYRTKSPSHIWSELIGKPKS